MKTHAVILDLPFVCRQSSYIEKVNCNWWKIDLRWTTDYLRDVLFLKNPTKPHSRARSHLRAETRSRLASPRYRLSTEFEVPSDDRIRFSGDVAPRCICCSKPKHSWEHECTFRAAGKRLGNTSHEKENRKMIRWDNLERFAKFKFNIALVTLYDDNSRMTGHIIHWHATVKLCTPFNTAIF